MADKVDLSTSCRDLLPTADSNGCSVTTSSQKVLDKLNRKDRRRAERAGADIDADWLAVYGAGPAVLLKRHHGLGAPGNIANFKLHGLHIRI